jgi:type II secretory ATPase GspE/PulE/Tfp pilus assembly ATPase PilB-like protein
MTPALREAILGRADAEGLAAAAAAEGYRSIREEAAAMVAAGRTTAEEVERVLGAA